MKKRMGILFLGASLFWGTGIGLAIADTSTTTTSVASTKMMSSQVLAATTPVMSIGGASPATDAALQKTAKGDISMTPIPVDDFVNHVERKMFQIVMGIRQFSIPYAIFVLTIGGLVLMIPFKMPMQKGLGFGIIGFGLLGFVLIWFGPVLLGIAQSLAQP